jgi:diguanylate cyclase (GGDEF)-like protein
LKNIITEIVDKTLEELKKARKDAYPLYYKNVFNNLAEEEGLKLDPRLTLQENINENLLNTTKETANFILEHNKELEKDSKNLVENIEINDTKEETKKIVKEFENKLLSKLEQYQKKIEELNKELEKAYRDLHIDSLTKAYNRKALEEHLNKILEAGKNKNLNLFVMVLDLDYFKEINDTYGHLIGDFVLIKFVQIIKNIIRKEDKIYRFGGDEFVIIFNRIEEKNIMKIANKIVEKVASTKLKYKDNLISLTTSIGVTCYKSGDTIESILKRADGAVYKSKKQRNKATIQC